MLFKEPPSNPIPGWKLSAKRQSQKKEARKGLGVFDNVEGQNY